MVPNNVFCMVYPPTPEQAIIYLNWSTTVQPARASCALRVVVMRVRAGKALRQARVRGRCRYSRIHPNVIQPFTSSACAAGRPAVLVGAVLAACKSRCGTACRGVNNAVCREWGCGRCGENRASARIHQNHQNEITGPATSPRCRETGSVAAGGVGPAKHCRIIQRAIAIRRR